MAIDRSAVFARVLHRAEPGFGNALNSYFSNTGKSMQAAAGQVQAGNYQQALGQMWKSNPELFTTIISAILGALFNKDNRWAGALGGAGLGAGLGVGMRYLPQLKAKAGGAVKDVMAPTADDLEARMDRKFSKWTEAMVGPGAKEWKPGDKPLAEQAGAAALRGAVDTGKDYGAGLLRKGQRKLQDWLTVQAPPAFAPGRTPLR